MTTLRRTQQPDRTWLYIASFILLTLMTLGFEHRIELNETGTLPIDYN